MHSRSTAPCTRRNSASSAILSGMRAPGARHDHADEAIVETVFDADQRGGDLDQRGFVRA